MKVRKSGNDWFWIVFKYENPPTFCFICGLMGHSDKFCSRLFDTPESEIVRPYGSWMRAPFRRQTKMIGAKWLRNGNGDDRNFAAGNSQSSNRETNVMPQNQGLHSKGEDQGDKVNQIMDNGGNISLLKENEIRTANSQFSSMKKGITVIESKKRRTDDGLGHTGDINKNTELNMGSEEDNIESMEQDVEQSPIFATSPKNVRVAGLVSEIRQAL